MTRGERNNNPGNIRVEAGTDWLGQVGWDSAGFLIFDTPEHGIRAIAMILHNYRVRHGLYTITQAIVRWAPPSENNVPAYVDAVCTECAIGPYDAVDFDSIMPRLVRAIIHHELGNVPYTDEQIETGVNMAVGAGGAT